MDLSPRYRIKEVKKYGKNYFVPQVKRLCWWSSLTEIVDADLTGYIDEREIRFSTFDECREFVDFKKHKKDVVYHYVY